MSIHQLGVAVNGSAAVPPTSPRPSGRLLRPVRRNTGIVKAGAKSYATIKKGASVAEPAPTVAKQFADAMLDGGEIVSGVSGPWAVSAGHTSGGEIVYRWNSLYWQHVGSGEGSAYASKWIDERAPDKATAKNAENSWSYASMRLRLHCPLPVVQIRAAIVPCADVYLTIDAATGKIVASKPNSDLGMTHALSIPAGTPVGQEHVPQALPSNSRFRQWLEVVQPDPNVQAFLQEQCGATLLPQNYSVAAWWYGAAGSGKSMLAEICEAMQRQVARVQLDELGGPFGMEQLVGCSLIIVDEVEKEKWAEGRFKSLVSGNGVSVARKFEKAILSYHSSAKWIITSNPAPYVYDKTDGVWRRLAITKFDVSMPQEAQVPNFHLELLKEEGRSILDWMLEGAQRIVRRGRFLAEHERPQATQAAKLDARMNSDTVLAWVLENNIRVASGEWTTQEDVYKHYVSTSESAQRDNFLDKTPFWRAVHANSRLSGFVKSNRRIGGTSKWCVNLVWGEPKPKPSGEELEALSRKCFPPGHFPPGHFLTP